MTENEQETVTELVQVGERQYRLDAAPPYTDPLVREQSRQLLGQLSLGDVTDNLYLSVELFNVAYNGVAGARSGALQSAIADIQSDLALLCNKCILTMTTFKSETERIISLLVGAYRRLVNCQESLAVAQLSSCAESSTAMSTAAGELADAFRELQVRSTKVRSDTIQQEASEHDREQAAKAAERELRAKQASEQTNQNELVSQMAVVQQGFDDAKAREQTESTKALVIGITSAVASAAAAGLGAYAATTNPLSALMRVPATGQSPQLADAQRTASEKQALSADAQKRLLTANDEVTRRHQACETLRGAISALADKEKGAAVDEADRAKWKAERETKQKELTSVEQELAAAKKQVENLEPEAKKTAVEYAAAAKALESLGVSTGAMSQAALTAEQAVHAEKMKLLEQRIQLEKERRASLVALAEYTEQLKNLTTEQGAAAVSVNSLHAAVEALGKIIGTLTNASLFWAQMSSFCRNMSRSDLQDTIKLVKSLDPEDRIAEYRSQDFMKSYLVYLCQWVAVNGLSGDYLVLACKAQQKAIEYLGQSPTIEDALKKAPELARSMGIMLNQKLDQSRQMSSDLEQQKELASARTEG